MSPSDSLGSEWLGPSDISPPPTRTKVLTDFPGGFAPSSKLNDWGKQNHPLDIQIYAYGTDSSTRASRASIERRMATIPASSSLSRSSSSASFASARSPSYTSRAGSIRSTTSSRTARSSTSVSVRARSLEEIESLKRLHALATAPIIFLSLIPHAPNNHNAPTDSIMPFPHTLLAALHARCPVCTTTHCCGSSAPLRTLASSSTALGRDTPAPSTSSPASGYNTTHAPPPCAVSTHCLAACALGALAALLAFDRAAAVQSQGSPRRATDKALLGPMHAVVWCIERPSYPQRSHRESQARSVYGGSSYRGSDNREDDEEPQEAHSALLPLIALSHLPGYVVALLQAGLRGQVDVGTWMARAPVYGAVLRVLRAGAWLRTTSTRTPSTLPRDRHGAGGDEETLLSLIRRLEPVRLELLRLADRVQFGPTVETAHALCDGVIYLLLQGMHQKDQETEYHTNEMVEEKEDELAMVTERHAATELYMEELRAQVTKLTEREASTEAYVRDLEEKMKMYDETSITSSESMTDLKRETVEQLEAECERRREDVTLLLGRLEALRSDGDSWRSDLEDREQKKKKEAGEARTRLGVVVGEVAEACKSLQLNIVANGNANGSGSDIETPLASVAVVPDAADRHPDPDDSAAQQQLVALQQTHTATLATSQAKLAGHTPGESSNARSESPTMQDTPVEKPFIEMPPFSGR
ncbi:hypothetical protein K438DRAFT_1984642 [Mycena galopus ATCC 62051]|nr:hypothetical protein K438DRAFT_1984642 [Mycena galopus ATCC 62051]